MRDAIGLDIGGANLKAATTAESFTAPFELWRYPERLSEHLVVIRERWPHIANVAVTMTGELCDCFSTKRDGVRHILAAVEEAFPSCAIRVWSTEGKFISITEANEQHMTVAAANWHALATWVGRDFLEGPALLLDVGSTTTDIIPILNGLPIALGKTDPDRLRSGELVYTGVRRTPICALLGGAVAAEWFATSQDAYVRLDMLPPEETNCSTADGRPMTEANAHARLSRMLGGDPEITTLEATMELAESVFTAQRRMIATGICRVLARMPMAPSVAYLSGSGEFLARVALADAVAAGGINDVPVHSLTERLGPALSEAACAHAVAMLAGESESWD